MNSLQVTFLSVLALYIVAGTAIALVSRKLGVRSIKEYFVAGHRLGGVLSAISYAATTYSAFMMVGLVGIAYATGVGALGFELAYLLATLLLLGIFAENVWKKAREKGWLTSSQMLSDLYNSAFLGGLVAFIYLFALLPYTSAQLIGIGSIFEGIGAGYSLGVGVGAVLVLAWIVIGGVWSIATTDLFQGLWMIIAAGSFVFWLVFFLVPSSGVNLGLISDALTKASYTGVEPRWPIHVFLAYTIPWWFFAVTNPQVVRKLYMPADEGSLKKMIKYFGLYGFLYTVIVVFVGMVAKGLTLLGSFPEVTNRDLVTPILLTYTNPVLASVIYVSIVAAAITTSNSIVFSVGASFIQDLVLRLKRENVARDKTIIHATTLIVIILTSASAAIALTRPTFIVEMSVLSSVILLPLAPVTIAAWISPSKASSQVASYGAIISLVLGVGLALGGALAVGPKKALLWSPMGIPLPIWVLFLSGVVVLITYLVTRGD